ncbi:MAG: hypothetical protein RL180_633 [Pseudomonadota bacterium]
MCIVALAWQILPNTPVLLLNNRDEFFHRPTAALAWWADANVLAGRDLEAQGTWLGIDPTGRWAVLTNYREKPHSTGLQSRGELVRDYLSQTLSPLRFAEAIALQHYAGFNLIVGDQQQAVVVSNRGTAPTPLAAGLYVLSNASIDDPWPKVERLRQRVGQELLPLVHTDAADWVDVALEVLADRQPAADDQLPDTGIGQVWEKMLSSILIESPVYGTCASSVVQLTTQGYQFIEQTRGANAGRVTVTGTYTTARVMQTRAES